MKSYRNHMWLAGPAMLLALLAVHACKPVKVPPGVEVVEPFDVRAYTGKWYEIARFDFKQEKNMKQVTAEYTLNDDGSIKVINRGFDTVKGKWKDAIGKAKFVGEQNRGALKVSFFGPFYSGYNVVAMEPPYQNALVFGEDTDYIWILSRNKTIPEDVKNNFLRIAREAGYDVSRLIWTKHD
ncbi:MAG TPA: lipocalin family protein [Sphingobacterium sp.]|jgi:apolipoprotein D and lipocalin family protein|nr:lipocalin family protein [Sphingobacterium sp.]